MKNPESNPSNDLFNLELLRELSEKYLSNTNQIQFEDYLAEDKPRLAAILILGALDTAWASKKIGDNEFRDTVDRLGLTPEERAQIRSNSEHAGDF